MFAGLYFPMGIRPRTNWSSHFQSWETTTRPALWETDAPEGEKNFVWGIEGPRLSDAASINFVWSWSHLDNSEYLRKPNRRPETFSVDRCFALWFTAIDHSDLLLTVVCLPRERRDTEKFDLLFLNYTIFTRI